MFTSVIESFYKWKVMIKTLYNIVQKKFLFGIFPIYKAHFQTIFRMTLNKSVSYFFVLISEIERSCRSSCSMKCEYMNYCEATTEAFYWLLHENGTEFPIILLICLTTTTIIHDALHLKSRTIQQKHFYDRFRLCIFKKLPPKYPFNTT